MSEISNDSPLTPSVPELTNPCSPRRQAMSRNNLAEEKGNAVPVLSVNESFRIINENGNSTFDRSVLRLVQTPQVFRVQDIKKAYDNEFHPGFTDDANVLEKMGHKINLCEGDRGNIKITRSLDLLIAEAILKNKLI